MPESEAEIVIQPKHSRSKVGKPEWVPARQTIRKNGTLALETQEAAWERMRFWVKNCKSMGMQDKVIAQLVQPPCSLNVLKKNFAFELEHGKAQVQAMIAAKIVNQALAGSEPSQRFYMETQAGWRRNSDVNLNATVTFRPVSGDEEVVD